MNFEQKYKKYKYKYVQAKKTQDGGKKDSEEKEQNTGEFSFKVKCVHVKQSNDTHKFEGKMCKTPAIRMRFKYSEVSWALIVKSLLRFVNKSLRIKFVKKVNAKIGKDKISLEGDNLKDKVDLSQDKEYDEIEILL